jgi:hypothetical protein
VFPEKRRRWSIPREWDWWLKGSPEWVKFKVYEEAKRRGIRMRDREKIVDLHKTIVTNISG